LLDAKPAEVDPGGGIGGIELQRAPVAVLGLDEIAQLLQHVAQVAERGQGVRRGLQARQEAVPGFAETARIAQDITQAEMRRRVFGGQGHCPAADGFGFVGQPALGQRIGQRDECLNEVRGLQQHAAQDLFGFLKALEQSQRVTKSELRGQILRLNRQRPAESVGGLGKTSALDQSPPQDGLDIEVPRRQRARALQGRQPVLALRLQARPEQSPEEP
jgi:hypothetical protein